MSCRLLAPVLGAALIIGCAPSAQQVHLDRIEGRMAEERGAPAEAEEALARVERAGHLDKATLVRAVLKKNPSLEAARASWEAAVERYHERDAMPDPVLSYSFAPGSIFDPHVRYGQAIQLSQTIPWVGKLRGRGDVALYEADMKAEDYEAARLELALEACRLYDRYYAVARALDINREHQALVERLRKSSETRYEAGKGTLYDPIQAEVVLTHLHHEQVVLTADRAVIAAQINALLHRAPEAKLPPPPNELPEPPKAPPPGRALQDQALQARPELAGAKAESKSIEASIDVAQREYAPDFTLFGSYNSMWDRLSHQFMFGISAPLPVVVDRRAGAEAAARARLRENASRQEALADRIRAEVFEARERYQEAQHVVEIYREKLMPLANKQAQAVRAVFATGEASFFEVMAAERAFWNVEREYHEALALAHTRRAELDRALGRTPGLGDEGAVPKEKR